MEPHAAIAEWDGDRLTLRGALQMLKYNRNELADALGIAGRERPPAGALRRRRLRLQAGHRGGGGGRGAGRARARAAGVASCMHRRQVFETTTRRSETPPAHPACRRRRGPADRARARSRGLQPARRSLRRAGARGPTTSPTPPTSLRIGHEHRPHPPARRRVGPRPGRGGGRDRLRDGAGRTGRGRRASTRSSCACATSPTRTRISACPSRPTRWPRPCARAPAPSAGQHRPRRASGARANGGSAPAWPRRSASTFVVEAEARVTLTADGRRGRDRHDRHRHRQLRDPQPDRGRDAGPADADAVEVRLGDTDFPPGSGSGGSAGARPRRHRRLARLPGAARSGSPTKLGCADRGADAQGRAGDLRQRGHAPGRAARGRRAGPATATSAAGDAVEEGPHQPPAARISPRWRSAT